ncbi:hypothetical protein EYC84_012082 [Monilinia fructicola]|uniref:Uncharacterized protein n=1 Tax=Monilinia fructicola TaxID=38448 RepID=A0A5M9J5X0_MONFR|nr:hypothetical protein EYC84_012082 [Monilinia fructicola]
MNYILREEVTNVGFISITAKNSISSYLGNNDEALRNLGTKMSVRFYFHIYFALLIFREDCIPPTIVQFSQSCHLNYCVSSTIVEPFNLPVTSSITYKYNLYLQTYLNQKSYNHFDLQINKLILDRVKIELMKV